MSEIPRHASNLVRNIWISAILSGLLAVVVGVVILAWPEPSVVAAAVFFGVYLVVSGLAVVLGILAFRHFGEGYAVVLLAIWIATGFIFRGVSVTASAIGDPRFPGRGWAIFFGLMSIIAGFVVLAYPFDSIVTLALVVGIWLIILGITEIVSGFGMRSDVRKLGKMTDWPGPAVPTTTDKPVAAQ